MKKFLILQFSLVFTASLCAQWVSRNSGSSKNIYNVQMVSANTGYWTGASGTAKTVNGGINWSIVNQVPAIDLHFFNANTGFIGVSNDNFVLFAGDTTGARQIYATNDAGSTWTTSCTAVNNNIFNIGPLLSFPDSITGYSAIGEGLVAKTTNGGAIWSNIAAIVQYINGIYFTSDSLGYLVEPTAILKTIDNGVIWTPVYTDSLSIGGLNSAYFLNANTGFVSNTNGSIFKTTNGGNAWIKTLVPGTAPGRFFFLNPDTGFVADMAHNGEILQTLNAGVTWERIRICTSPTSFNAINFSGSTGVAVGDSGELYTNSNFRIGPGKPFAMFKITSATCDSMVQFTNNSYSGYQCKWYYDGQYASNNFNYSHAAMHGTGSDTVMLVVSNGTFSDSSIAFVPKIAPPPAPNLSLLQISADTICTGYSVCLSIGTSYISSTYTITSDSVLKYSFSGISDGQEGHCVGNIRTPTRLVFTIANTGLCQTVSDSIVKEAFPISTKRSPVTLLDSVICLHDIFRVKIDSSNPYYQYFIPFTYDTVWGNGGTIYLTDTFPANHYYGNTFTFSVAQISPFVQCALDVAATELRVSFFQPDVNFTVSDSMVFTGEQIQLYNLSNASGYNWYFDSTATRLSDTATNTTIAYTQPGEKQVTLIAQTTPQCKGDTITKLIFVGERINADPDGVACFDANIEVTTYPNGGILAYHVDRFGNSYVGGYAFGTSFTGGGYNYATYAYLRKTDKQGNLLWYKSVPSAMPNDYQYYSSYITGITSDPMGNVYIAGSFGTKDNFQFDSLTLLHPEFIITNNNNGPNFFAAKFDSAGNDKWLIASYQTFGASSYLGATDIQYADDKHIYLSVIQPNSFYSLTHVQYADTVFYQTFSSINIIQIDSSGHFISSTTAKGVSQFNNTNYKGNIYGVFDPNPDAIIGLRRAVMGPRLFVHPDCTIGLVGFFVDSINFNGNMGIHSNTDVISCYTARVDPVRGWLSANTLFGSTYLKPEFGTLMDAWPSNRGITDWLPRCCFDSHDNIYVAVHIDTLYLKDTTTALNLHNYNSTLASQLLFSMVAKFDENGKIVWFTKNRNYSGNHHITGLQLSSDESRLVLTGNYTNALNLASTHRPPVLMRTHLAQAPFIAAMDTAGNVQWINNPGPGDINSSIMSVKTGNDNIYTIGLKNGYSHEFKYNLWGNCNSPDSGAVRANCNGLLIALTGGSLPFCEGDSLNFTALPSTIVAGAVYQWHLNGATSGSNNDVLHISNPVAGDVVNCLLLVPGGDTLFSNSITLSVAVTDTPAIIKQGDSLIASYGISYNWYLNGTLLPTHTQALGSLQNGTYIVIVKDSTGCSTTSLPFVVVNSAVTPAANTPPVLVYPSPTTGKLVVEITPGAFAALKIYDLVGNQLYSQKITSSNQVLDIGKLAKGVYTVTIELGSNYYYFKIAKE